MPSPDDRQVSVETHPHGFQGVWAGDRLKGWRGPSLFAQTHDCTTRQYPTCRLFQARQESIAHEDVPATSQGR